MRLHTLICIFGAIFDHATADGFDGDLPSPIKQLDAYNYQKTIKETKIILVEFFAPWCNHCKQFNPEFEKAAQLIANEQPPMTLAQVDCTDANNIELCKSIPVKGYPTLMLYHDGKVSEHNPGLRTSEQVVKMMRAKFSVPSFHIRTREQYEQHVNHPEGSFIGFFPSLQGTEMCGEEKAEAEKSPLYDYKRAYFKIVQALIDDHRFGHITDPILAKEIFTSDTNPDGLWETLIFHRPLYLESKFEPLYYEYTQPKQTAGLIKKWAAGLKLGLVPHVTKENFHALQRPIIMAYYNVDFKRDPKGTKYWRNRLLKVASQLEEANGKSPFKYQFAVGARKEFENTIFEELGGNDSWGEKGPKIVIWDEDWNTYRMEIGQNCQPACDLESDGSNLRAFLEKFENDELEPYIKSETPPENNDGPVKIVVGHTFQDIVMDPTKDVFVKFYAPWCGHCKTLEPIWEELGEKVKDDPNIVIAKIDVTGNHPPRHFSYEGFPTIFWAGMSNKFDPKKYEGHRQLEGFLAYMRENVKVKPMIIDGQPDDIEYDDYDDDIVSESEEEIDSKYGKEPEGFHEDEEKNEDEEYFDEDVDEDATEDSTEDATEDATEGGTEESEEDDSWDNLNMADFEFAIEKEAIPEEIQEKLKEVDQETVNENVKGVDYGPGTDHDQPINPETGAPETKSHDEL